MATLTLFFNSDSDIYLTHVGMAHGLDRIHTEPRMHVLTELSRESAFFYNRYAYTYFDVDNSYLMAFERYHGDTMCINGPGSGYFLSDAKFIDPSSSLKLSDEQFNKHWTRNTRRTLDLILGKPPQVEDLPVDEAKMFGEYPNDWVINNFDLAAKVNPARALPSFDAINLVGWGRGAVSCHMLANHLSDSSLASLPINILAIDPIIGGAVSPALVHTTLGANVQEYVGFYARDERSASLPCIVPNTASNTRIHIYPIAGRHTTLIGNQAADGDSKPGTFSEPADLIYYLARKCLNRWNPSLRFPDASYPDLSVNGDQVLAKIKSEYDNYINMRNTTYSHQSQEVHGEREILLDGQLTNFKSAQGTRFTPNQGLAKGHIEEMSYFQDIT
ncbi:hypothetical protein J3P85_03970 [Pseudomonas sp. Z1-12]|uniref:hypothetical protein n=1 Tax=Pseudomonas sp. Z1-12 TaxID=2817408 RepID=UPI003DA88C54